MRDLGGRPPKFKSVEEMQQKIDAYFDSCWAEVPLRNKQGAIITTTDEETGEEKPLTERIQVRPYTITGLAVALDTTRETLLDYEHKDEFSDTVKKAKAKIEQYTEEQLFQLRNPAGAIFNLVNNYKGWSNKQEVKSDVNANVKAEVSTNPIDYSNLSDEEVKILTANKTWVADPVKAKEIARMLLENEKE